MNKALLRMIVALVIIFGLIFGAIYGKKVFIGKMMASYVRPPVTVSADAAVVDSWERTVSAVGTLQAQQGADLSAEVKGVVRNIAFHAGDVVAKGAILVELDDRVEQANLKSLEAQLRLAEINFDRDKRLISSRAISKTDFDTVEARLKDAQAQVERTRALIDKMHIRAPFDGRVGMALVKVGQYVSDGDALVTFQSTDALYLEFSLPERYFQQLTLGQSVHFVTDSYPGRVFDATVSGINVKVDDNTRSILVRADVSAVDAELLPGMFANIDVVLERDVAGITVPQTAITYSLYGNSVFLIHETNGEDGAVQHTVERSYVEPGMRQGSRVAIASGLVAGDKVVTAGQIKLSNGTAVIIDNHVGLEGR
jgi:membrane fusion protein (multidrug efflux system)